MATYEEAAAGLMKSNMNGEFVWEGDIVELTGRYACPIVQPNMQPNIQGIIAAMHVEVRIQDKDTPVTKWVEFRDLKLVRSVTR